MQLGRRGFTGAVENPRSRRDTRRRIRGSAAVLTCVLVVISIAELAWILAR
jgi:hypothetical protein